MYRLPRVSLRRIPILPLLLLASATAAEIRAQDTPSRLTLEEALATAARESPILRARRAEVDEARGRLLTARIYPFNPLLGVEAGRRRGPGDATTDRGLGISQEIEIAGQRRHRRAAARAELDSAAARLEREQRLLAARVELAFAEAVRGRDLAAVAELDAELTGDFLTLSERRLSAGAATQLDVNLARATRGRAARRLSLAQATEVEARSRLAASIGLDPSTLPAPAGDPPAPAVAPPLAELLRQAVDRRADLEAFRWEGEAARSRERLAHAERVPNLDLGAFYDREEGTDRIFGGGFSVSLPLFNRNQGAIAEAAAAVERLGHRQAAFELDVGREVVSAHAALKAARAASEELREQVLDSTEESLELLRRAFEAGKIGAADLLLFRRELVESRREYIETLTDAWLARITLDLAAGRFPTPDSTE